MEELQGAGGWSEEVEKVEEDVGALVEWGPPPVLQHPRGAKHRTEKSALEANSVETTNSRRDTVVLLNS